MLLMIFHTDAQCIIDIYLNYDCDPSLSNIFKRLLNDLSRIAQGQLTLKVGISPQQKKAMRVKGLECLVSILKCLMEWSHNLYIDPSTTGLNEVTNIGQASSLAGRPVSMDRNEVDTDQIDSSTTASIKDMPTDIKDIPTNLLNSATDDPEQFEKQRLRKEIMEQGMAL